VSLYDAAFRVFSLFDAEQTHEVVFAGLRLAMRAPLVAAVARRALAPRDPALRVRAFGTTFDGPLGLAAGFDKNGLGPDALMALGFSFVEVGTVTARAQPGNDKPRLFRLKEDRALVNRLGFNNEGAHAVARRLDARAGRRRGPIAVNIGKTKVVSESGAPDDYAESATALGRFASFVVVNVSSPNTPNLRDLQSVEKLGPLLTRVRGALDASVPERRVPLAVKIAPDLADADVDAIVDMAMERGIDGIVATNTTIARTGLTTDPARVVALGPGGLSGAPLRDKSLALLARIHDRIRREPRAPTLVGVGGIATAEDAWQRIVHGATLLELYTSFIYEGPLVAHRIHEGLSERLAKHGLRSLEEAVGSRVGA